MALTIADLTIPSALTAAEADFILWNVNPSAHFYSVSLFTDGCMFQAVVEAANRPQALGVVMTEVTNEDGESAFPVEGFVVTQFKPVFVEYGTIWEAV